MISLFKLFSASCCYCCCDDGVGSVAAVDAAAGAGGVSVSVCGISHRLSGSSRRGVTYLS